MTMRVLARALITAVAFFELSDDEIVDPDAAVQILEDISGELSECSNEEKAALKAVLAQMKASEQLNAARPEVLEFLERSSRYCVLNQSGEVVTEGSVATTRKAMTQLLGGLGRCRIAMEVGTHSPWVSRLLGGWGTR